MVAELGLKGGYPSLYHKFAANVVVGGLEGYIVPLALDSANACALVSHNGIVADMLHLRATTTRR